MSATAAAIAKALAALLSDEKGRRALGRLLVAILSPIIVLIAILCCFLGGASNYNNTVIETCLTGGPMPEWMPTEYQAYIGDMQNCFSALNGCVSTVNGMTSDGAGLDEAQVKAAFYVLCFGTDAPSTSAADSFVACFYTTEIQTRTVEVTLEDGTVSTEEEEYTVAVPLPLHQAYANLEAHLGRVITEDDKSNIDHIYAMIVSSTGE